MIENWLAQRIQPDGAPLDERARSAWGKAASGMGIVCNALLFAGKMAVGLVSGSVAITADAFNNLSDASSSVVSLLGFKMADKPADAEHPYGHGRYEYLSGLMVAVMILVIGVELMKTSVGKILHPQSVAFSWPLMLVLVCSIAVKLWMSAFNRKIGRRIGSKTLTATADDSRNDVIATAVVLLATVVGHLTGLQLDGWLGAAVAAFILFSGFMLVKDTIDPLLGGAADAQQVERIRKRIMSYPGVLGTHDLIVHDYGPGRQFASVHVEMDAQQDPFESHDLIDNIERDFFEQEKLHLVIHYDPIAVGDPRIRMMREFISGIVACIHPEMSIHDLRIVPGPTHVNVVFDCIVPYEVKLEGEDIRKRIARVVQAEYPNYYCVIKLEHSFTGK
ncbi:MAG: cation transporter [Clostridiales bacterium]|nr:cation transporter [Clostridiales bacterium]